MGLFGHRHHLRSRFYDSLATAIDAGLTTDRALALLGERRHPLGRAASGLEKAVARGQPLSEAMNRIPELFTTSESDVVEAGERAGRLPETLRRLSRSVAVRAQAADRLGQGLVYPCVLMHGIILLPPLFLLFRDGAGAYLATVVPLLMLLYGAGFALWLTGRRWTSGKTPRIRRLVTSLPVAGNAIRSQALAEYAHVLATLFAAGIPILEALEKAARAGHDTALHEAGRRVADQVRRGASLHQAMAGEPHFFTSLFVESVRVGETAGTLETSLEQAERFAREQAEQTLRRLAAGLPVVAYAIAAVLVAWVVLGFWGRIAGVGVG